MKKTILFSLTLGLMLSYSCTKEIDFTEGNITGNVNLFDETNNPLDESGMTITVQGTSISATTDANGTFDLPNVPFGTYTLVYSKSGYGTFKRHNILHENTPTFMTGSNNLSQVSSTSISGASVNISGDTAIVSFSTTPAASTINERYYRVFYSTDMNVSNTNFEHSSDDRLATNSTPSTFKVLYSDLISMGYQSGETVFCKIYGDAYYSNEYTDNGVMVYPNVNATSSSVQTIVIP